MSARSGLRAHYPSQHQSLVTPNCNARFHYSYYTLQISGLLADPRNMDYHTLPREIVHSRLHPVGRIYSINNLEPAETLPESSVQYKILLFRLKYVVGTSYHEHHTETCLIRLVTRVAFWYIEYNLYIWLSSTCKIRVKTCGCVCNGSAWVEKVLACNKMRFHASRCFSSTTTRTLPYKHLFRKYQNKRLRKRDTISDVGCAWTRSCRWIHRTHTDWPPIAGCGRGNRLIRCSVLRKCSR